MIYGELVEKVRNIDLEFGLERLELGLLLGESIPTILSDAAQLVLAQRPSENVSMQIVND